MYGSICGIVLLGSVLLSSINFGSCQSPCPNYFRYLRDDVTGELSGRIEIPGAPKDVALHIRISLSVATALPTKYVGKLELATSRSDAVKAVREGRPLVYRLQFPVRNPVPLLTEILFNNQQYCRGPPATGGVVTSIYLEHTLYPPGVLPLSDGQQPPPTPGEVAKIPQTPSISNVPEISNVNDFTKIDFSNINDFSNFHDISDFPEITKIHDISDFPDISNIHDISDIHKLFPNVNFPSSSTFPKPVPTPQRPVVTSAPVTPRPMSRPTPPPPPPVVQQYHDNVRRGSNAERCGRPHIDGVNTLIAHGAKTTPGQWPWLAAIFITKVDYEFQCAGSLVTEKHVITAAHCQYDNYSPTPLPASTFLVSVGRYRLLDFRERGSLNLEVIEFRPHPDYASRKSADSDIALMILRQDAPFTQRIQPLCLWDGGSGLQKVVGRNGFVVGWGKDEYGHQHLEEPRMAQMPIVSQQKCLDSNEHFKNATSSRTFCAGMRDGSGPCNGDSGSAFVMRDSATGKYTLRGIVSLSLRDTVTNSCDLMSYLVYVDAAKYLDWIRAQTNYW